MIKVPNKKAINNLAFSSFKANKMRNAIAAFAIALTTVLFTCLFTIGIGVIENFQRETMRQAGGSAHASIKYLTDRQFEKMKDHPLIKEVGYTIFIGMADNKEFLKRRSEINYTDEVGAKLSFVTPTTGKLPSAENEIAMDTLSMDLLGIPHRIGEKAVIDYTLKGKKYSHTFTISGYWEGDAASSVGILLVSKSYANKTLEGISPRYWEDYDLAGTARGDIMFKNSINIEKNVQQVITDSGYLFGEDEYSENNISYGVNWSYISAGLTVDASFIAGGAAAILLVIFAGYLIIYNIFQISVMKDIRFYGLLKTIGTTPKQLKSIIIKQALLLSAIGIPVGLVAGYLLGVLIVPVIISISTISGANFNVSINPIIFLGAALFSLITVFISCGKPGSIAAKISPIEAVRYSGTTTSYKKTKQRATDGGKLYKMAVSNTGRNKKRTAIVLISLSLGLILFNTVYTLVNGFDMDKFLSKFVKTDFLIGHANYFNNSHFRSKEDEVSQSFIDAVSNEDGFLDGGKIYYYIPSGYVTYNGVEEYAQIFGAEDFPLSQFDIVEGEFDLEKYKTGKYIIEGLSEDDYGNIYWDNSHYDIGEKVVLTVDGADYEYIVMAKCRIQFFNHVRYFGKFNFYLPSNEFCRIVESPTAMSYIFDVDNGKIEKMEKFVSDYTSKIEILMDYESKYSYASEFYQLQYMFLAVGGVLSFIIGLIGILNFVNSIITSIISRRQEFAMLQSIGMTNGQLKAMLVMESLFYTLGTIILSLVLGIITSFVVVKSISLWFFSYKFIISPLIISYPVLIILSVIIPLIVFANVNKQSIVERLREVE